MLISRTQLRRSYRQENQLSWVFLEEASQKCGLGTFFTSLSVFPKKNKFSEELPSKKLHSMVNWTLKCSLSCLHKLFITANNLLQLSKLSKKMEKIILWNFCRILLHISVFLDVSGPSL